MADLAVRLRCSCNCNIDTSPCGAEEECRLALEAAAEIERLRAALDKIATYGDEGIEGSPGWMLSVAREWARVALSPKCDTEKTEK
jgi:hypothetical protein